MVNYGVVSFGQHYIIKLRAKLLEHDLRMLDIKFNESLHVRRTIKGFALIEGCLPCKEYDEFRKMLDIAMLDSKIAGLQAKKEAVSKPSAWYPEDVDML